MKLSKRLIYMTVLKISPFSCFALSSRHRISTSKSQSHHEGAKAAKEISNRDGVLADSQYWYLLSSVFLRVAWRTSRWKTFFSGLINCLLLMWGKNIGRLIVDKPITNRILRLFLPLPKGLGYKVLFLDRIGEAVSGLCLFKPLIESSSHSTLNYWVLVITRTFLLRAPTQDDAWAFAKHLWALHRGLHTL